MPIRGIVRDDRYKNIYQKEYQKTGQKLELSGKKEEITEFKTSRRFQELKKKNMTVCFKVIREQNKNERIYYQKGFVEIFNELLTEEEKNYIRNINTKNLP